VTWKVAKAFRESRGTLSKAQKPFRKAQKPFAELCVLQVGYTARKPQKALGPLGKLNRSFPSCATPTIGAETRGSRTRWAATTDRKPAGSIEISGLGRSGRGSDRTEPLPQGGTMPMVHMFGPPSDATSTSAARGWPTPPGDSGSSRGRRAVHGVRSARTDRCCRWSAWRSG